MRVAGIAAVVALLAVGAFVVLLLPTAQPAAHVVAGTTTAADLSIPDPDLAVVAGLAQGPSILGIPTGPVPARVLAVPADAPEELGRLEATGRDFSFTDPSGQAWTVTEYQAAWGYAYGTTTAPTGIDANLGAYNFVLLVDHTKAGPHLRLVAA